MKQAFKKTTRTKEGRMSCVLSIVSWIILVAFCVAYKYAPKFILGFLLISAFWFMYESNRFFKILSFFYMEYKENNHL